MGFFPSDWDDEEEDDDFGDLPNSNPAELVKEFESNNRDNFSAQELMEIFKFYALNQIKVGKQDASKSMKNVLLLGIKQFPYMAIFFVHMAEVLLREKNYRMARKYIQQAKENNHTDHQILFLEAAIVALEKNHNKAVDLVHEALETLEKDEDAIVDVVELYLTYQLFDLILIVLKETEPVEIDFAWIIERHILASSENDELEKMIPVLEFLIDKEPYSVDYWYLQGLCYNHIENYEKAAWAFDFAVTLDEDFTEAWLGYLESIYELERYEEFLTKYRELVKEYGEDTFEDLEGLSAWALFETGKINESRQVYRKVLKKQPYDSESWYSMGLTYHYEQQFETAIPYLQRAWEQNPSEPDYGVILAASYLGAGQDEKWPELYLKLSEIWPENEEIWLDWGVALFRTGETDNSIEVTEMGLKQKPQSHKLMYRLAALAYLTGQQKAAEFLLESALLINAEDHQTMFIFAPELKKSMPLLSLISRFIEPKLD